MIRLLTILSFLNAFGAMAQECFIDESFSPKQFKGNKVKLVKVTVVEKDSTRGRHAFTYELSKGNKFTKSIRHSAQSYLETSCSWSADSNLFIQSVNSIDLTTNKVLPIKRVTREYNKNHQVIMHSIEELMGNYSRQIARFNPDDLSETHVETIGMQNGDTVVHNMNKQSSSGFLMVNRQRKDGIMHVHKQVVVYKDSLVDKFEEYEDGVPTYSRKGNPGEVAILRKRVDPESRNVLPFVFFENNDTLVIDAKELPAEYRKCLKNFKEKKLKMIIKYFRPNKLDTYGIDYLYMNGLPLISHVVALNTFNLYEYEFYKENTDSKKPVKKPVKAPSGK